MTMMMMLNFAQSRARGFLFFLGRCPHDGAVVVVVLNSLKYLRGRVLVVGVYHGWLSAAAAG